MPVVTPCLPRSLTDLYCACCYSSVAVLAVVVSVNQSSAELN